MCGSLRFRSSSSHDTIPLCPNSPPGKRPRLEDAARPPASPDDEEQDDSIPFTKGWDNEQPGATNYSYLAALRTGQLRQTSDQFVTPASGSVLVPESSAIRPELWQVQSSISASSLRDAGTTSHWTRLDQTLDVKSFFDPSPGAPLAALSNFFLQPFSFVVPAQIKSLCIGAADTEWPSGPLRVKSAEQAIMLCKALLLGSQADVEAVCAAPSPQAAKRAGRQVKWPGAAQRLWNSAVCGVALAVLHQKFADPAL